MKTEKVCGTCFWHKKDELGDWYCVNEQSEKCTDFTWYTDSCDEYEERG